MSSVPAKWKHLPMGLAAIGRGHIQWFMENCSSEWSSDAHFLFFHALHDVRHEHLITGNACNLFKIYYVYS